MLQGVFIGYLSFYRTVVGIRLHTTGRPDVPDVCCPFAATYGVAGGHDPAIGMGKCPLDTICQWQQVVIYGERIGPRQSLLNGESVWAPATPEEARHRVDSFKAVSRHTVTIHAVVVNGRWLNHTALNGLDGDGPTGEPQAYEVM